MFLLALCPIAKENKPYPINIFLDSPMAPPQQEKNALSYKDAGVDIDAGNALVEAKIGRAHV